MSVEGTWDLIISSPVGRMKGVVQLRRQQGQLVGTALGVGEEIPLTDITLDDEGRQLTWNQAITKPLRLNLAFSVTIDGDALTGTSKTGRLPASKVTGQRRAVPADTQQP